MTTFGQLVDQINSRLHSYTGLQEQVTSLLGNVDIDDLQLLLDDTSGMSRGIVEIDDELLYVKGIDTTGAVLPPFGRGFRGSTAASHSLGAMVVFDPVFPRVEIKAAINQCLESIYPQLYQIKETTLTFSASQATYELPADCDGIIKVIWDTVGPSNYWPTITSFEYEANSEEASGKAITFLDFIQPGRTVKIVYKAKFTQFVDNADTFAAVGLQESMLDVLLYGATSKLIRFLDPTRLQINSVENLSRAQVVAANDAGKLANQLYAMYQQRLAEERRRLLTLNPPQISFSGA